MRALLSHILSRMDWERELTVQIGHAVDARRQELGLSAQALSHKTAELGHEVSRTAIADYSNEKRRRRISVADLLVLARALEIPPLYLLFPGQVGDASTYLPGKDDAAGFAALRFVGETEGYATSNSYGALNRAIFDFLKRAMEFEPLHAWQNEHGNTAGAVMYKDELKRMRNEADTLVRAARALGIEINLDVSQSLFANHLPNEFRRDNGAD
ncbi:hypothetical protein HMPREF3130_10895 [Corynebacterium sp. HMSC14B06]|nr:hypothetical protein HMPREF3130_10895 [Corynebacterium sp. HMSC14B06]